MKILRWLFWLFLLGGLVVFLVAVPIDGRTCMERLQANDSATKPSPPKTKPSAAAEKSKAQDADQLTEKDRQALNKLIDEKLDQAEEKAKPN